MDVAQRTTEPYTITLLLLKAKKNNEIKNKYEKCIVGEYKLILPICLNLKVHYLEKAQSCKAREIYCLVLLPRIVFISF